MYMDYNMNRREPHAFCFMRNFLYSDCDEFLRSRIDDMPLVQIKGKKIPDYKLREAQYTMQRSREKYLSDGKVYVTEWFRNGRMNLLKGKCESWFKDNYKFFRNMFLRFSGYDSIEAAVAQTDSFGNLWAEMESWFMKKEESFKKKMELEIKEKTGVSVVKTPSSHGGVANLLKTLTRTMEKQGASIESIAKVQYAICVQAGIYIPDEFLLDVATALTYKEAIEEI